MNRKTPLALFPYSHINSIENLSDEIFYEIFDYLDGYDISRSFSKLNQRFENLVNNSSSKMKIQINRTRIFDDHYQEYLQLHQYHIQSLQSSINNSQSNIHI